MKPYDDGLLASLRKRVPVSSVAAGMWRSSLAIYLQPRQLLIRLGVPGIVAIGLLIACMAFYVSVMLPLDVRIDQIRADARGLATRVKQVEGGTHGESLPIDRQLAEFYRLFPPHRELTDIVDKVFETAHLQGITLQRGEYRISEETAGRLQRFQILLPVKAEYPNIRRFLAGLAAEIPTVALEHLQFERQKIGDRQVEATIKLNLYLERTS